MSVVVLAIAVPPAFGAISDYQWTAPEMSITGSTMTAIVGTAYGTALGTFDDDYTVTATCVFGDHSGEVFCGPQARQNDAAPDYEGTRAYAFYLNGPGNPRMIIHRIGGGSSERVLAQQDYDFASGVEYTLRLTVEGTTITGCIDGGPCIVGNDGQLTSGTAGVGIRHTFSHNPSPEIVDFTYDGEVNYGYDGTFSDDDGSTHEGMIEAIAAEGITTGCSVDYPQYFCPFDFITRGQMATFLARALDLPPASQDYFIDDAGSTHEDNINRIAEAGITLGCATGDGYYCPNDNVTRGQMALFLDRGFGYPPSPTDWFTDDDGTLHESAINSIADAGVTLGCDTDLYCPADFVQRAQMASFIGRALGLDPIFP